LAILYGNGKDFEKKILKNKICSEVFDLNDTYVNVVDEK
jgi:hypothetical protein